jgi:hypothetical protein
VSAEALSPRERGTKYCEGTRAEPKTAKDTGKSHKIIIQNSPSQCRAALEYVINNPGCKVLDYQLHLGLHRGNKANLPKRLEISDCFEILTFGWYILKKGNQYYPTSRAFVVTEYKPERKFGSNGLPRVQAEHKVYDEFRPPLSPRVRRESNDKNGDL